MDSLIASLSIGFLFRSLFAGIFFVISMYVGGHGIDHGLDAVGSVSAVALAPTAMLAGITMNAFHRSYFYPIVEYLLETNRAKRFRKKIPLISDATIRALRSIWALGSKSDEEDQARAKHLAVWGDATHFQYVSALCLAAGAWSSSVIFPSARTEVCWPLVFLFLIFAAGAAISDWRLKRTREGFDDPRLREASGAPP